MTERKPDGMSFRSWIDQQISEATERGAFDNLPGLGKPLRRGDSDDPDAWVMEWVRREGVPAEELLPTPLKLRKQAARLADSVQALGSEQAVRDAAAELNDRIMEWRRLPLGPPIFVPLVDTEAMVGKWQAGQPAPADDPAGPATQPAPAPPARRWWRRSAGRPAGTGPEATRSRR
jgi:hypothetical protein